MAYHQMSHFYDVLSYDQPYDKWDSIVETYLPENTKRLLDIGCGTGQLTAKFTKYGDVVGVDLSEEMLEIAKKRNPNIEWYHQDMRELNLSGQFDVITIFCDSLNYVTDLEEILQVFYYVEQYLTKDGVFIFDVHSTRKMNTLFNDQCYIDHQDDLTLTWEAIKGEEDNSVWHELSFFIKTDEGLYKRFDETHYQQTYDLELYQQLLSMAGFKIVNQFTDFNIQEFNPNGDRHFIVAKKIIHER